MSLSDTVSVSSDQLSPRLGLHSQQSPCLTPRAGIPETNGICSSLFSGTMKTAGTFPFHGKYIRSSLFPCLIPCFWRSQLQNKTHSTALQCLPRLALLHVCAVCYVPSSLQYITYDCMYSYPLWLFCLCLYLWQRKLCYSIACCLVHEHACTY